MSFRILILIFWSCFFISCGREAVIEVVNPPTLEVKPIVYCISEVNHKSKIEFYHTDVVYEYNESPYLLDFTASLITQEGSTSFFDYTKKYSGVNNLEINESSGIKLYFSSEYGSGETDLIQAPPKPIILKSQLGKINNSESDSSFTIELEIDLESISNSCVAFQIGYFSEGKKVGVDNELLENTLSTEFLRANSGIYAINLQPYIGKQDEFGIHVLDSVNFKVFNVSEGVCTFGESLQRIKDNPPSGTAGSVHFPLSGNIPDAYGYYGIAHGDSVMIVLE